MRLRSTQRWTGKSDLEKEVVMEQEERQEGEASWSAFDVLACVRSGICSALKASDIRREIAVRSSLFD